MAGDHLMRSHAPITAAAWEQIDEEAASRLRTNLAGRRVVDFDGPHGWRYSAHDLGRADALAAGPQPGVAARLRRVQPLVELRVEFRLDREELAQADRGNPAVELGPLTDAARQLALTENTLVFHGYEAGGIRGLTEASAHAALPAPAGWDDWPAAVATAVATLRDAGVDGAFALALGEEAWRGVSTTIEAGGYPVREHLARLTGGPLVWAPGVAGAVLVSQRGGDFVLHSGQDLSVGYLEHDRTSVTLYLEESLTFRVLEPDAAIAIAG